MQAEKRSQELRKSQQRRPRKGDEGERVARETEKPREMVSKGPHKTGFNFVKCGPSVKIT